MDWGVIFVILCGILATAVSQNSISPTSLASRAFYTRGGTMSPSGTATPTPRGFRVMCNCHWVPIDAQQTFGEP